MRKLILLCSLVIMLGGCGSKKGANGDLDAALDGDGVPIKLDAALGDSRMGVDANPNCVPGTTQCTNCIDDDQDGKIDGSDIECTGALDNSEGSFGTGIPGDNIDPVDQDCFFDGNSGAGNDGCSVHVCCILGAPDRASCPFGDNRYNPTECSAPLTQQCIDNCAPLAPPGCDCFGCCTVCDAAGCVDIATNPLTSPNCTDATLRDPTKCLTCEKNTMCGTPCGGDSCVLCPGQDPSTLPPGCGGAATCPAGITACTAGACPAGKYCSVGCCIDVPG